MKSVAVIDFGLCNLDSIRRALEECGGAPRITQDPADIAACGRIVIPGVGAYPDASARIRALGLHEALAEQVLGKQAPCLGICLGMHLLSDRGEEEGGAAGLGFIHGHVKRLSPGDGERVPHVGWNEVYPVRDEPLFRDIAEGSDFYFVHSFHFACRDDADVVARTPYGGTFASAVARGNIVGVQFHPEKSQKWGFSILRNFLECY